MATGKKSVGKRFFLNVALFAITSINTFTIRGDGPSGFGEVVVKAIIFIICIALLISSAISLTSIERSASPRKVPELISSLSAFLLALFAILAIVDACSDQGGHCRRDGIHLSD